LENTQGALQSGMPGSNSETWVDSVIVWTTILWYSILLVPLLPFMAKLLQGSMWRGWVIRRNFQTTVQFFKMTVPPLSQLELFSHGLRAWRCISASFLASTITRFQHHWTTLVSFGD
jgi:hypothetical protein